MTWTVFGWIWYVCWQLVKSGSCAAYSFTHPTNSTGSGWKLLFIFITFALWQISYWKCACNSWLLMNKLQFSSQRLRIECVLFPNQQTFFLEYGLSVSASCEFSNYSIIVTNFALPFVSANDKWFVWQSTYYRTSSMQWFYVYLRNASWITDDKIFIVSPIEMRFSVRKFSVHFLHFTFVDKLIDLAWRIFKHCLQMIRCKKRAHAFEFPMYSDFFFNQKSQCHSTEDVFRLQWFDWMCLLNVPIIPYIGLCRQRQRPYSYFSRLSDITANSRRANSFWWQFSRIMSFQKSVATHTQPQTPHTQHPEHIYQTGICMCKFARFGCEFSARFFFFNFRSSKI